MACIEICENRLGIIINKYQIVEAVITRDNEIIPIWDARLEFFKDGDCGNKVKVKDADSYISESFYETKQVLFNLKTKELSLGIELDYYPENNEFKIDDKIMYDTGSSRRKLKASTIVDIVFERYEISINKGSKIESYWRKSFKDFVFQDNLIYTIKQWSPTYILDDGTRIKYTHQMFHLL